MNNISRNLLANFITFFHICIILFIIFAPFTNILYFLILHVTFSISLLVHWYNNNNICSLSLFESKLRNLNHTQTFSHRLISPIYDISETNLSKLSYIIVITTMIISIYKIYTLPKTREIWKCIKGTYKEKMSFSKKLMLYGSCILEMMTP